MTIPGAVTMFDHSDPRSFHFSRCQRSNLVRLDELAVPSDGDGRQDVVAGDHDGVDVGVMEALDRRVSLLLDQVLHHDQTKEFGFLFKIGPKSFQLNKKFLILSKLSLLCLKLPS